MATTGSPNLEKRGGWGKEVNSYYRSCQILRSFLSNVGLLEFRCSVFTCMAFSTLITLGWFLDHLFCENAGELVAVFKHFTLPGLCGG